MTPLQHIHRSFTIQLSLWVAGSVLLISVLVMFLLARFSRDVIRDESLERTRQTLVNMALRIDNSLRLSNMSAEMGKYSEDVSIALIEQLMKDGNYVMILNQTLPNVNMDVVAGLPHGKSGFLKEGLGNVDYYYFFEPICNGKFSIVITFPVTDLYGRFSNMQQILLSWGIIGVLMILIILWMTIGRSLRPLHLLADSAQRIADGHLDETIPDSPHKDEVSQLQNSLSKMQMSQASYMREMRQNQAILNRQNDALEAAYKGAQEYEEMKAKFLQDMSNRLSEPVANICQNADVICKRYQTMSISELTRLQNEILRDTEAVTLLVEQLQNSPNSPNSKTAAP